MANEFIINVRESLIEDNDLKSELSKRKKDHITESVDYKVKEAYLREDWEIDREFKTKVRVRKTKPYDLVFIDQIWSLFANLGFTKLNKDRHFSIPYSLEDLSDLHQFDTIAIDDQTILLVTCKSTKNLSESNFSEELKALGNRKEGITKCLRKIFPGQKHKIKFILSTKGYYLCQDDQKALENFGIVHFDEETIDYYSGLYNQLGLAARFQLLGNTFAGQNIPELDNCIPAIEGKMGNRIYYSFSIEPEKLLTIGYILHRNNANKKMMPTYQRLIKKSRLKSILEFVDSGGYFPNTIIINIDSDKKLQFDRANTQVKDAVSNVGILHLPKKYRSAFIIDGQHRLYGYAGSKYRTTNSIPVVAFINLTREEQVKLFMQINENQKSVPKNLRKTLESELLWSSDDFKQQQIALKSRIGISLGDDKDSPLYGRIIIGENNKTPVMCVTIDAISRALNRSSFFGKVSKNTIIEPGTFFNGDINVTYERVLPLLKGCFAYLKEKLSTQWEKGEDGIVVINKGIFSFILLFSDIINHLYNNKKINPYTDATKSILEKTYTYLEPIAEYFTNITDEEINELKSRHGSGGDTKYWRNLQEVIRHKLSDFNPDGLDEYLKKESKMYNEKSFALIRDLEQFFKQDFKSKLEDKHGTNWWKKGIPQEVYESAEKLASQKNRDIENPDDEVNGWDCLNLIDYRKIALKNWDIFQENYTKPGEEKISGGKDGRTGWMTKLERIRNQNFHSYSVSEEEFNFLSELYEWLIKGDTED